MSEESKKSKKKAFSFFNSISDNDLDDVLNKLNKNKNENIEKEIKKQEINTIEKDDDYLKSLEIKKSNHTFLHKGTLSIKKRKK
jgi:predicted N-acyltransferase